MNNSMYQADQFNPISEEVLINEAVKGSLEAFNQLVLRYQDKTFYHAYNLLGDAASAEDITQESFIKAFQNISGFRGGSFRAWLLRIVTNTAYDFLRKSKKHPVQSLFPEDGYGEDCEALDRLADPSASVEATVEQNEEAKRLYRLLEELPDRYRSVLILADLYELDYWEVAEILKVPIGTVKSRLARARMQLKSKLQDDGEYFEHFSETESVLPS
jgi:RNA polymerase sigma-70 factor, ECF subfamily